MPERGLHDIEYRPSTTPLNAGSSRGAAQGGGGLNTVPAELLGAYRPGTSPAFPSGARSAPGAKGGGDRFRMEVQELPQNGGSGGSGAHGVTSRMEVSGSWSQNADMSLNLGSDTQSGVSASEPWAVDGDTSTITGDGGETGAKKAFKPSTKFAKTAARRPGSAGRSRSRQGKAGGRRRKMVKKKKSATAAATAAASHPLQANSIPTPF